MSYTFNPFTGNLDVTPFSLDGAGKIPSDYLPSYVDDVVEYDDLAGFPGTGETGKIYVAKDTGYTYRWTGSVYVRIGSGGEVELNLGSAGSPSLFFNGDANTGIYSPGADQVAISTNGTGRLFVDSSGRVGVGTSNQLYPLSIQSDTSAQSISIFGRAADDISEIAFFESDRTTKLGELQYRQDHLNLRHRVGYISFSTGGVSERLRITSDGKVGLGTSAPDALLTISSSNSASVSNSRLRLIDTDTTAVVDQYLGRIEFFGSDATGAGAGVKSAITAKAQTTGGDSYLTFSTSSGGANDIERLRIDSSGNVGIGTTSPGYKLDVTGSIKASVQGRFGSGSAGAPSYAFDGDHDTGMYRATTNALGFVTAGSERLRIDSSGRILVGTSSVRTFPSNLSGLLQVESTNVNSSALGLTNNQNTGSGPYFIFGKSRGSSVGSNTVVQTNDQLGSIWFTGTDGSQSVIGASIRAFVDGTPGADDMPGRLEFSTTADGASSPTERLRIDKGGNVILATASTLFTPWSYNNTSANAANVYIDASGVFRRSTSSIKYKTNVETLQDRYADALLGCRPVWYQSTCNGDNPDWGWWGFIAEEVAEIDPRLVHWKTTTQITNEDGQTETVALDNPEPEGVQYDRFVPHLLNLIKRQMERIEVLEAKVNALEGN
jgi:hypothetical protein